MPSDPLPLSPETESGRDLLEQWTETWDGYEPCPKCGATDALHGFGCRSQYVRASAVQVRRLPGYVGAERHIVRIEQEARTLARAEVIADIEAAMLAIEAALPEGVTPGYRLGHTAAVDRVLTALSRLGERE